MENNFVYHMFRVELTRLQDDYQRCKDKKLKKEIFKDIQLLEKALEQI